MTYRAVMFPQGDKPPVGELYYGQDVREVLRCLPAESVHTVVTSPPYWALRNYQGEPTVWGGDLTCVHDWGEEHRNGYGRFCSKCNAWCGQLGLEPTPEMYVANMVAVFREIKRTLRDDGTLWLNIGDTFFAGGSTTAYGQDPRNFDHKSTMESRYTAGTHNRPVKPRTHAILKPKDLVGIPWRLALALQEDGWWLRNDIIWQKANHLPSPVQDRMTCSYEHIFLLSKSRRYYFDLDAIRIPHTYGNYGEDGAFTPTQQWFEEGEGHRKMDQTEGNLGPNAGSPRRKGRGLFNPRGKNPGDTWLFPTQPFAGAHFAVMPSAISERCLLAGTSERGCCTDCGAPYQRQYAENMDVRWDPTCDCGAEIGRCTVLDPFSGSGTTGMVALRRGRHYIGVDINESYLNMAEERVRGDSYTEEQGKPPEGSVLDIF